MAYKNKTYLCFDGDTDIHYFYLMKAWKHNQNDFFKDFNFFDAHEINYSRDSSKEESIKAVARLTNHGLSPPVVGNLTNPLNNYTRTKRNTLRTTLLFLFISTLLISCSVTRPTAYQAKAFTGGYSETQLAPDIYSVRFQGNGYTVTERANDFCLLRCAELTKQNGYKYFTIISNKEGSSGALASTNAIGVTVAASAYPSDNNVIKLLKDKPENNVTVYEADFIINSIKTKYKIK